MVMSNEQRLVILLEKYTYNPITGIISHVQDGTPRGGKPAGAPNGKGVWVIQTYGLDCTIGIAAWAIHHGEWPPSTVRYANGDASDARLDNLISFRNGDTSVAILRRLFGYDPLTGELYAAVCRNGQEAGKPVVGKKLTGYIQVSVGKKNLLAHRVVWAMHYGEWPEQDIDHINGDKADNRISNLRLATASQNTSNRKMRKPNSSGFSGANVTPFGKYRVRIAKDGKRVTIGSFNTAAEAHAAYQSALLKIHGEYAYCADGAKG